MSNGLDRRRRVSRETRLLLVTALLSVIALWTLARIRFPDQPAGTPVQPLLTQLALRPAYDSLASEIAQLRPRLEPLLVGGALRISDDAAVALLHDDKAREHAGIVGFDPASRLAVIQAPFLPAPPPVPWNPRDPQEPRYLVATDVSSGALSVRPVFVGSLTATRSPLWSQPVWVIPADTDLTPGSFVFTTDALLAGVVVEEEQQLAIVPGRACLPKPSGSSNSLRADSGTSASKCTG